MKGEVNIDDAVQQYKNTSVKVLAGSTPIQDTSTVLSGKNMRQFIKRILYCFILFLHISFIDVILLPFV